MMPVIDEQALDYLLGWLGRGQRRRSRENLHLQQQVAEWHECLHPLTNLCDPEVPPATAWAGVLTKLNTEKTPEKTIWLWALSGGGILAAGLTLLLLVNAPAAPAYAAALHSAGSETTIVSIVAAGDNLTITNSGLPPLPAGKSFELWLIVGDAAPAALGILPDSANSTLPTVLPKKTMQSNPTLAISIEPVGGSPGSTPTGPVILTGVLQPA